MNWKELDDFIQTLNSHQQAEKVLVYNRNTGEFIPADILEMEIDEIESERLVITTEW